LQAVCAVSLEPLFIVVRRDSFGGDGVSHLSQLAGKRLAVGSIGGGTRYLAVPMLACHGIGHGDPNAKAPPGFPDGTTFRETGGKASAAALLAGEVDAAFFAVDADTPYLRELIADGRFRLVSLRNADAYLAHFPFLTALTLHEGTIDLARDVPGADVRMVAPVTSVVARKDTHAAIIQLLVRAAKEVHASRGHPLAGPNSFPTLDFTELPVGEKARYFFNTEPTFLQRKLPFWLASLIDRLLILLVPLLVVLIPLIKLAPLLYQWRVRSKIYRWYKRLRRIDRRVLEPSTPGQRRVDCEEADRLESEIARVRVPLAYMEEFYNLRLHLAYLRDRLASATTTLPPADGVKPEHASVP
jgi:hypothetical protein